MCYAQYNCNINYRYHYEMYNIYSMPNVWELRCGVAALRSQIQCINDDTHMLCVSAATHNVHAHFQPAKIYS